MIERVSIQDLDLLNRLSHWADSLESHLSAGCGWLIFNSDRQRAGRIAAFLTSRLHDLQPPPSHLFVPWRDFAIHAYVLNVELTAGSMLVQARATDVKVEHEFKIASRVSIEMYHQMLDYDVVAITGIVPSLLHEVKHLDSVVDVRFRRRLPTILVTPRSPQQLEGDFRAVDPSGVYWNRIYQEMYETSLIAL